MIALRQASNALRRGSLEWLHNSDEARIVTYVRRGVDEEVLVAINFSNQPFLGVIEVGNSSTYSEITPEVAAPQPPDAPVVENSAKKRSVGLPAISLPAWGYRIFQRRLR